MIHPALERPEVLRRIINESAWDEFLGRNPAVVEMIAFLLNASAPVLSDDEARELRRVYSSRETLWRLAQAGRRRGGQRRQGGRPMAVRNRMREKQDKILDASSLSMIDWDEFPAIAEALGATRRRPALMGRLRRLAERAR